MHMIEQTPKEDADSAPGCSDTDEDSDVDELSWGTLGRRPSGEIVWHRFSPITKRTEEYKTTEFYNKYETR